MATLNLVSTGGGTLALTTPTTASNFTQTVPAATGTVMVSGAMPAFSAYQTVSQSISTATLTLVTFGGVTFDTNSNYSTSTNRFTPTVAGYYQVSWGIGWSPTANSPTNTCQLFKNGSGYVQGVAVPSTAFQPVNIANSVLVYMNGTTDYLTVYLYQGQGSNINSSAASIVTYFCGSLVRAA